jgi:TPP-dependent trihydroxycyclohexane-1,2-dione (THcHDO) dehydratase
MAETIVERRAAPRYALIMTAVVTELPRGTKLNVRSSDISRTGCYIDTLNSMAVGSRIKVKLMHEDETFEAEGRVAYVSHALGMGVHFETIPDEQLAILDRWLESARKNAW